MTPGSYTINESRDIVSTYIRNVRLEAGVVFASKLIMANKDEHIITVLDFFFENNSETDVLDGSIILNLTEPMKTFAPAGTNIKVYTTLRQAGFLPTMCYCTLTWNAAPSGAVSCIMTTDSVIPAAAGGSFWQLRVRDTLDWYDVTANRPNWT